MILIQAEIQELQRLFNAKFVEVAALKSKQVDRCEEKLARLAEIQVRWCVGGGGGKQGHQAG